MFKNCMRRSDQVRSILTGISRYSTSQEKWDLQAAICLEKKPIVIPNLNEFEQKFQKALSEIEVERSFKSEFEIRHENDVKQLEILKKGGDADLNLKQTAQDLIDTWSEELSKFESTYKVSDSSQANTLKNKLDKNLVLVVNHTLGQKNYHTLPMDNWKQGETLRQSAERILSNHFGDSITAKLYGNAPCGFYKYKYPTEVRKKSSTVGAKVFIYFARYVNGTITQKENDYKWLDRNELSKMLHPECYKSMSQFLISE